MKKTRFWTCQYSQFKDSKCLLLSSSLQVFHILNCTPSSVKPPPLFPPDPLTLPPTRCPLRLHLSRIHDLWHLHCPLQDPHVLNCHLVKANIFQFSETAKKKCTAVYYYVSLRGTPLIKHFVWFHKDLKDSRKLTLLFDVNCQLCANQRVIYYSHIHYVHFAAFNSCWPKKKKLFTWKKFLVDWRSITDDLTDP